MQRQSVFILFLAVTFSMLSSKLYAQGEIPKWNLADLEKHLDGKERPLLINFWATWCKPCVEELPILSSLETEFEGLDVVFLSLDFEEHLETRLQPFVEEHLKEMKVALLDAGNPNVWIDKVSPEWSGAIPATVLVANGRKYFAEGKFTEESLREFLKPIIRE